VIYGIGTDIVQVSRFGELYRAHERRTLEKILAPAERDECSASPDPARFIAKRFAAKEALGKAFGTGVRAPLLLPAIAIAHDSRGKPYFIYSETLAAAFAERDLNAHVSISDEREFAVAFVILETS
jgi:holo-[acyl-carrier protein] synthase